MATEKVQILIDAKNNASAQLKSVNQELSKMDKAASMAVRGFAALGGAMALQQAGRFAVEMAQLNTQIERSTFAFDHFSGGAAQAGANLRAVQRAAGGALTTFEAQNIAVTAMTQGLASNSVELERITRVARGIVAVSPIINDLETAFSQLGLTIANQSMMRLDQLGTSASEIKPKIEALKKANKDLTDEQAFQAALLGTLETKFADLTGAAINQASGLERLAVAWKEYRNSAATAFAWVDSMAGGMADALDQQTKFDFGKWLADQISNPAVFGEFTYAQKKIVSKIRELTDLSYLDKMKMGDQFSIQIVDLVDQFYRLGDAAARTAQTFDDSMNVLDASKIQGPNLSTFFTGDDWQKRIDADVAAAADLQKAIDELIEAKARSVQGLALSETDNFGFAQEQYESVLEKGKQILADQRALGSSLAEIAPMFATMLDNAIDPSFADEYGEAVKSLRGNVFDLIETLARAEQREFVIDTGDVKGSIDVYAESVQNLKSIISSGDFNLGDLEDLRTILNVLPAILENAGNAAAAAGSGFDTLAAGIRNALSAAGKIGGAVTSAAEGAASTVADFLASLADMADGMQMDLFSIGADFGQGLEGGRAYVAEMLPDVQAMVLAWGENGATLEEITTVLLPNYLSDLESANASLYRTQKGTAVVNDEFNSLKSTISGIVSGAIGPVAGVDANDLLPRPDAVNENARRLADIAVNGLKGQDWLSEFANEVPDIYQALVESGDPKTAAATMLKDFQDGLLSGTGVLIDKERAKALVRRALLGESNTQALINEIAQELAAETGTAFSTVQAQAQSILGGGGMSANSDTGAAFSRGMVTGVEGSSLGADLSGAVYTQVMASITLIEQTGTEAGNALVRGMSATFAEIPQNLIAALAGMVLPLVQAGIASQGTRTGAAAS